MNELTGPSVNQSPKGEAWFIPKHTVGFVGRPSATRAVVVPVVNEGNRIAALLTRMQLLGIHTMADIFIVDGGSTDGSVSPEDLLEKSVRGLLCYDGDGGLSAQLQVAYAHCLRAGYTSIVTIDGNNKDDPAAIPDFFEALEAGTDFVQGSRFAEGGSHQNTPLHRLIAVRFIHAPLLSIGSGFHWTDSTQGFRGYSSRMLRDRDLAIFRPVFYGYSLLMYLSNRAPKLGFRALEVGTARNYPGGAAPTKILGLRGNFALLAELFKVLDGRFNPAGS